MIPLRAAVPAQIYEPTVRDVMHYAHCVLAPDESLARAHARTGDPASIDAYLGSGDGFTESMVAFAGRYAEQNARDHAQLVGAIAAGTIGSRPG